MAATKTSKPAKDGTQAAFTRALATDETGLADYVYVANASTGLLTDPATAANQASILAAVSAPLAANDPDTFIGKTRIDAIANAFQDNSDVVQGATNDPVWPGSGPMTVIGGLKALYTVSQTATPGKVTTAAPTYTDGTTAELSLNTSGGLRVDGSGATQPISAASLPLPSGAGTAANQAAPFTPVAPGTAIATKALLLGGHYNGTSLPSFTSGQEGYIPVDQNGALNVGFDGQQVSPASVTSAATIFTQDMTGYAGIDVQTTSAGSGNTITFETSEDNITWFSATGVLSSTVANQPTSTTGSLSLYSFPKRGKLFRARVSTYGSGTVTVIYSLHKSSPGLYTGTLNVQGTIANGATQTASPVPMGFDARTANLTPVTNGQNVYGVSTLVGAQIVYPWSIPEATWPYAAASGGIVNTTTAVTLQAAGASGIRNYLKTISVTVSGTVTAASECVVRDGASGTVLWRDKLDAVGRIVFNPDIPLRGSAATLMEFATLTAMGAASAVYVNAQGFQGP